MNYETKLSFLLLIVTTVILGLIVEFRGTEINDLQNRLDKLERQTAPLIKAQEQLKKHIQTNGIDRDRADEISWATILSARAHGLPWQLVAAVIETESHFDIDAVSPARCHGLMQLSPDKLTDWRDPWKNVWVGAGYLREQIDRFGNIDLALASYNSGPYNKRKHIVSRGYVLRVRKSERRLREPW